MKKLFFILACVAMSVLAMGQVNQLVWANGRLLYGTPIESIDSLTYDEMEDVDTLHLLLPRTLIKTIHDTVVETQVVHDTVVEIVHDTVVEVQTQIVHDTVYVNVPCPEEPSTPSSGIGTFSVAADKQVTFSKGNLQYTQSTDTWSFAENQYDYIGTDNVIDDALADKIDLFGWSTSATNFGVSTSTDYNDYLGSFVDWGTNKIGNDAPNTWRTLTYDEWYYLLYTRTNADDLVGIAQVNGVIGLILLPDNWTCPAGVTFNSGFGNAYRGEFQIFITEQWLKLEATGAVFLPAAGSRVGSHIMGGMQLDGSYWSANDENTISAYYLGFHYSGTGMYPTNIIVGQSVRLVKDL